MRANYRRLGLTASLVLLLALVAMGTASASVNAASVTPIFVPGNPSCTDLGYTFGYKVDPPNSGTYSIDGFNSVTVQTDGVYFDWSATLGIDAVISKGGDNANLYVYEPPTESFGDTGLHSPINPNTGTPYGLSHIEFCYDYELSVSKTANTTFTRTFEWYIEKGVTPGVLTMFTGDSGSADYKVAVKKTGHTDSAWAVNGNITIDNVTPFTTTITGVSDSISGFGAVTPNCGVTFPYNLDAGAKLTCTYSTALPDATNRTNTATVTTSSVLVKGGTATAAVTFGSPTKLVNDTIQVVDSVEGALGSFSDSGEATYSHTFTCDADEGKHDNTATITETGQEASASVTVDCVALQVTKDTKTSFRRSWAWTIDKSADQSSLLLSQGQLFQVNYLVQLSAVSTDSDWAVSGNIEVANGTALDATLTSVSDVVSGGINATVNCGVTFPYKLVSGDKLVCTYLAALPDATSRTNTATATLQNTPSGTTDFTGTANVVFSSTPSREADECIDVSDTNVGVLGTVCASDAPKSFSYSLWFGAHPDADVVLECGENTHVNTASFVTNDSAATGQDSWTVNANVSCGTGCTLTPGYWKTHSLRGPAPYDDAWLAIGPAGADTPFFLSGQTYYQVLWTAPSGNPYYILAHAYIAAKLNILNGASSTPDVDAAIAFAESFFNTYTPDSKLSKTMRATVIAKAYILDQYNNGFIGPGHCSE
ncbi:MAG: hypothetical protein ACM3QS_04490 [Bacteroidota bacterium]